MKLLDKILVPVKINEISDKQLHVAIELAKQFGSTIMLLHVLPLEAKKDPVKALITDYVNNDFEKVLDNIIQHGVSAQKMIRYGNMVDQILSAADEENVNLIVIPNDFGLDDIEYSVDYLAEKLIRKSEKPVWVVKANSQTVPQKLLCSIDYSDASKRALNNAIKVARTFKAELDIITVFEPLEESYTMRYKVDYSEENNKLELENKNKFEEFMAQFNFTDVDYKTFIVRGKPHKEIIRHIENHKIDVLFMGATGKTFIERLLLGSVTELVIREMPSSLVITKSENILNLKIDADISGIEKHFTNAGRLIETGYYEEAIEQLKVCLKINDLYVPAINVLAKLYAKLGQDELAENYNHKADEILRRLWDKKIELEIRKNLNLPSD